MQNVYLGFGSLTHIMRIGTNPVDSRATVAKDNK